MANRLSALLLLSALFVGSAQAAWNPEISITRPELVLQMASRSTEQMQAFYEARGFPSALLKEIGSVCYFTFGVDNKTNTTLWLDLSYWQVRDQHGNVVPHRSRAQWQQRWKQLGLPLANRNTFGWTVMPEARDLYPNEHIGSNLTLLRTRKSMGPMTLVARFPLGKDKKGGSVEIKLEKLQCRD
ncbi:MAG: hypothetical protein IME93_07715 [Proteobacteria bacterium]|nr:hypothetical protein [Pseudomonadota bacterium]